MKKSKLNMQLLPCACRTPNPWKLYSLLFVLLYKPIRELRGGCLEYTNKKLEKLVARIHTEQPIKSRIKGRINWEQLAEMLIPVHSGDAQRDIRIKARFGELWRRLASDFLDTTMKVEYNSFKHGLRVSMHGSYLAIGSAETPKMGASPEALHVLVDSKFGSSYFMSEKLDAQDGSNIRLVRHSVNWNPQKFVVLLQLVSISINNIGNTLRCAHGVPSFEAHCLFPIDDSTFDLPWELEKPGISALRWDRGLDTEAVVLMTREDILASYGANSM